MNICKLFSSIPLKTFTIHFHFAKNDYFENEVLTKKFVLGADE